ncbi:Structural maintenance of chromosomes protein 5, variant 2 [Entomophthora muscae]|uniref:Structural maintenance of chromosomes protein 5, variant 2 n=1 Tax=Entomophthora muscae TaxID=34485 RepID=A0ACC2T497_9FUNG|nr:Structural maintenance of chromosomes protein 5, variant 2 [Entomophthora muscae]
MARMNKRVKAWDAASQEESEPPTNAPPNPSPPLVLEKGELPFFSPSENLLSMPTQEMTHRPGSILKVRLEHFVTYEETEFFPGPNMNMVIGPNGTGKSTIVCAIALGLGGAPGLLGRAKEISEYVKHGKSKATIQIELQNEPTSGNRASTIVITRQITRESNASHWMLNGKASTLKEIQSVVKRFNIQVDNLCQFLPQDKVAEFAEMGPTELLLATQKAAGEADMHAEHSKLILLSKEQKEASKITGSDVAQLEMLESSHDKMKKEIERYRLKEGIIQKMKLYQMRIAVKRYEVAKESFKRAKARNIKAAAAKEDICKKQQPLMKTMEKEEKTVRGIEKELEDSEKQLKAYETKLIAAQKHLENLTEECNRAKRNLSACRDEKESHSQDLKNLKNAVRKLQVKLEAGPPSQDEIPELVATMKQLNSEIQEVTSQIEMVQNNQNAIQMEGAKLNQKMATLSQRIRHMDNNDQQRRDALARRDPDTGRALEWLEKNRHLFREHVFRPLILEVKVKDERFAAAIEHCLVNRIARSFLCQNKSDYDLFTKVLIDQNKLRIAVIMPKPRDLASFRPPMPVHEIQSYGFHDYALNLVEASPPVLVALCDLCYFHSVPISLGKVNNTLVDESRKVEKYIAEGVVYRICYSSYGARKSTVQTNNLPNAQLILGGVDQEYQNQIQNQIAEVRQKILANEESIKASKREEEKIRVKDASLRQQLEIPKQRRSDLRRAAENFNKLELELDKCKRDLDIKTNEDMDEKILQAQLAVAEAAAKQTAGTQKLEALVAMVVQFKCQMWAKRLALLEAKAKKGWVERSIADSDLIVRKALELVNTTRSDLLDERDRNKALLDKAQAALKSSDKELLKEFETFEVDASLRQLEHGLDMERAKFDFLPGISEEAMKQFQQQTKEIETLKRRIAQQGAEREKLDEEITLLRESWEPRITALVAKISDNFSRGFAEIGCSGEVALDIHEDYSKWGVNILVKFREAERLQVLTGQRQSGGVSFFKPYLSSRKNLFQPSCI